MVEVLLSDLIDRGGETELDYDDIEVIKTMIGGVDPHWNGSASVDPLDSLTRASFDIIGQHKHTQNRIC